MVGTTTTTRMGIVMLHASDHVLPPRPAVRELLASVDLSAEDLSRIVGVAPRSVMKYLYGERAAAEKVRLVLVRELGERGRIIVGHMERARADYEATHPIAPGGKKRVSARTYSVRTPLKPAKRGRDVWHPPAYAYAGDEHDEQLYSIEDWKRLFGEPGLAWDVNGRMWGAFPSEPCFCGD